VAARSDKRFVDLGAYAKGAKILKFRNSNSETDDSEGESSCSELGGEDLRYDTIEEEIITDDLFMNTYNIT